MPDITYKAKFGDIALGDRLGDLAENRSVGTPPIQVRTIRRDQTDYVYHKSANYAVPRDRKNTLQEVTFTVVKYSDIYTLLDGLKAHQDLQDSVKALAEANLEFTQDDWASVFIRFPNAVFRSASGTAIEGGVAVELTFLAAEVVYP